MWRYLAGAVAGLLLLTGVFFLWQGRAADRDPLPSAPPPAKSAGSPSLYRQPLSAPEASPKNREEKRFSRADKDKDGKIEAAELLDPRRKAFAKLDANGDGALAFNEWAVKTIEKIQGADRDRNGWLSPAEYASTAPPPPKKARCGC